MTSHASHAFDDYYPLEAEGLVVRSRRNLLKAAWRAWRE